jgi:hypothetical protein
LFLRKEDQGREEEEIEDRRSFTKKSGASSEQRKAESRPTENDQKKTEKTTEKRTNRYV